MDVNIGKLESDYGSGYLFRGGYGSDQYTGSWNTGLKRFGISVTNETFNFFSGNTKMGGPAPAGVTSYPAAKLHIVTGNSTNGGGFDKVAIRIEDGTGENNSWSIYKRSDNNNLILATGGYSGTYPNQAVTTKGTFAFATGIYTTSSDRRLKKNISLLPDILDNVLLLKPSFYHFNEQKNDDPPNVGFIAQEVNEVMPYLVSYDNVNDLYSLAYSNFSVIAIKAIQEQQSIIIRQGEEIEKLKRRIAENQKEFLKAFQELSSELEAIRKSQTKPADSKVESNN